MTRTSGLSAGRAEMYELTILPAEIPFDWLMEMSTGKRPVGAGQASQSL